MRSSLALASLTLSTPKSAPPRLRRSGDSVSRLFTMARSATMIVAESKRRLAIMGRFPFFVLVERHGGVATPSGPWAAAVPGLSA
jgi:hypothetical protein